MAPYRIPTPKRTYLAAELLKSKALGGVNAQLRVGLDDGKATGH